ncbi:MULTISPECIES: hypothetical protein [Listeriaceae]|nr:MULTISPECIES: hypothetical protein [Listeria]WAO21203.1 hypothetical protein OTR81_13170 [Listeria newyorkensis]
MNPKTCHLHKNMISLKVTVFTDAEHRRADFNDADVCFSAR